MAQNSGTTFNDSIEVLDGNVYDRCVFNRCRIVYSGGALPMLNSCQFNDCTWTLGEAAERTLIFLRLLYHGMGPGGKALVDETLKNLLAPAPQAA
jgi:hypothetical protein